MDATVGPEPSSGKPLVNWSGFRPNALHCWVIISHVGERTSGFLPIPSAPHWHPILGKATDFGALAPGLGWAEGSFTKVIRPHDDVENGHLFRARNFPVSYSWPPAGRGVRRCLPTATVSRSRSAGCSGPVRRVRRRFNACDGAGTRQAHPASRAGGRI